MALQCPIDVGNNVVGNVRRIACEVNILLDVIPVRPRNGRGLVRRRMPSDNSMDGGTRIGGTDQAADPFDILFGFLTGWRAAMSDIKLFRMDGTSVNELESQSVEVEKSLQSLIEKHLDTFLGVRFLATEYATGKTHGGRIDTLGIDENGCPVIVEYKRSLNENVINQGLFYLDWLMDHKAEFELLVLKQFGRETADVIEWSSPRLLCIAGDFTKYDQHAVQQINRNIELIRYKRYGNELLLFELVNVVEADGSQAAATSTGSARVNYKTVSQYLADADAELRDRFELLKAFLLGLGDDVQMKVLKYYIAFTRLRNFACIEIHTRTRHLLVYAKANPKEVELVPGFSRDVTDIGHYGTGDLELIIRSKEDLERAKPLLLKSYKAS